MERRKDNENRVNERCFFFIKNRRAGGGDEGREGGEDGEGMEWEWQLSSKNQVLELQNTNNSFGGRKSVDLFDIRHT